MLRKTVIAAAVMFGVVGGVAGGMGSSNLDAAGPAEGLLVQDVGGWGGGGYCQETWRWANGGFALTINCTDGTSISKFIGGGL